MATQLFLLNTGADCILGTDNLLLTGSASTTWHSRALGTSRGSGVVASASTSSVTGPTAGVDLRVSLPNNNACEWISPPVAAGVTISGTITVNLWAAEATMTDNVAINVVVEVIRANTTTTRNSNTLVEIARSTRVTEVALTTRAVNNFTVTPTSTGVNRGDRLRVRVFGDDAGTMASGGSFNIGYNGDADAADGDSYVTFSETFSFESAPAGSVLYLTDTASAVSTASVDREAWTSRGSGVQTDVTNTAAGPTAPIQVTDTAGGTAVDWFTRPLTAFTLTGMAVANIRGQASIANANAALRCEIARVNSDGTSPTVWASWCMAGTASDFARLATSEEARTLNVSGDDLSVSDGQRLRIRIYVDDSAAIMAASQTVTLYYAGTSGGASGDSYITLPQTVTEYGAAAGEATAMWVTTL